VEGFKRAFERLAGRAASIQIQRNEVEMRFSISHSILALMLGCFAVTSAAFGGQQMSPQGPQTSQSQGAYSRMGQTGSQDKSKEQATDAEFQAAKNVESGKDAAARLQAAGEFVKKYPKSTLLKQVATLVASKISEVQDATQKIGLAENYLTVFKGPAEQDVIAPMLIEAYFRANKPDDAFKLASAYFQRNPNDVPLLTNVTMNGVEQVRHRNNQYVAQTKQYGSKAIEQIQADKKPELLTDAQWSEYKTKWLPLLYQQLGLMSLLTGDSAEAKARLEKAMSLNPSDPFNYYFMGGLINDQYQKLAAQYKGMLPGPEQDQTLKQALAQLDQVIDLYAHSAALSEGSPSYKGVHEALLPDLETYYKYRHNGSTEGLQQLIDKYKK